MKKPVTYYNSRDDRFAGSIALLIAVTIAAISLLLLSMGYPGRLGSIALLVISFVAAGLSYTYLTHTTGGLRISERGIDYLPENGKKTSFPWGGLARISILPGWLFMYDREDKRVFSFTYGPGKQHALIRLFSQFVQKSGVRPEIWPEIELRPARAKPARKKSGVKKMRSSPAAPDTGAAKKTTQSRKKPATRRTGGKKAPVDKASGETS